MAEVGEGPMSTCVVRELMTEACSGGARTVILEGTPDGQARNSLDGVAFDLVLDLGGLGDGAHRGGPGRASEWSAFRKRVLSPEHLGPECTIITGPEGGAETSTFSLAEPPRAKAEAMAAKDAAGSIHVHSFKFAATKPKKKASAKKKKKGEEKDDEEAEEDAKDEAGDFDLEDAGEIEERQFAEAAADILDAGPPGMLVGRVLLPTDPSRLYLELSSHGCETTQLAIPVIGQAAAWGAVAAVRAACVWEARAAGRQSSGDLDPTVFEKVTEVMKRVVAPPGSLEVLTAREAQSRVTAVLHQAATPREMQRALKAVCEWATMGDWSNGWKKTRKVTVLLGCEGGVSRGDRAKYGWALADLCDCAVLTSDQPRGEAPMQIVEDVLEAIRARVQPGVSFGLEAPAASSETRLREVRVIADRTDAIKSAVCSCVNENEEGPPGIVVVFSSGKGYQEAPGVDGKVVRWLHDDRRLLLEALEAAERLSDFGKVDAASDVAAAATEAAEKAAVRFKISRTPWYVGKRMHDESQKRSVLTLPGQSLHWTYSRGVGSDTAPVPQPL